jgi:hypothetical protein
MVGTVVTSNYRADLTRLFVEEVAINNYYLFVSNTDDVIVSNSKKSKINFLENTLFGKRIDPDEVFFMIRNYPWLINNVYDQYDDIEDLSDKRYYAVVYPENNQTGDYRIYKCLFNNYGAQSINPPNFSPSTPDQIYRMADGYVWKFMFALSEFDFERYNTIGYIPIPNEIIANTSANSSTTDTSFIDQIFVTNPSSNRGYEKVDGNIFEINTTTNEIVISEIIVNSLSAIENYYSGYTFYVTNSNNDSQAYEVLTYVYNPSTKRATIKLFEGTPADGILVEAASYVLLPRVEIRGDGAGAVAIANVSNTGVIDSVTVLNNGSGYTSAEAFISDPFGFDPNSLETLDERVILRPILSTVNGHGTNLVDELSCRHALVSTNITEFDNSIISAANEFASVGIVRNPEFKTVAPNIFDNRIELALDSHSLLQDEIITQVETEDTSSQFFNDVRFRGKVHEVSNNFVYICEYMGPFPNDADNFANTDFTDISLKINLPLLSSQNEVLVINTDNNPAYPDEYDINYPGFSLSPYVQRSGEVYYMSSFLPITRTEASRERFKILLEF